MSNAMWRRLAFKLRALAITTVSDKNAGVYEAEKALKLAAMAEACIWQATGEADCFDLKVFVPKELPTP
jgi:hypothetical protein